MARTLARGPKVDVHTLRNYVNGDWVEVVADQALDDLDPATGEPIARLPLSEGSDVDVAVRAATDAQPLWRACRLSAERGRWRVTRRRNLADLVTLDMGKTTADAIGEVDRGIESIESAAAACHLLNGGNLEGVARGLDVEMVRQPVGVERVNACRYGNASAIFTSSGGAVREYRYGVAAGIGVNVGAPAPTAWFPFAGWSDSSDGDLHANGTDASSSTPAKKVVTSRWS